MIFKGRGFRMDVDVERTRAYYEAYAASGKATLLQRNQQAYFDKVLSPGAKGFLRMLGIVNHLPMGLSGLAFHWVDGPLCYELAVYPLVGHVRSCGYKARRGPAFQLGADGRLYAPGANTWESQIEPLLAPVRGWESERCRALFPGFPGPLAMLACQNQTASWVLEEICPVPGEAQLREARACKRRLDLAKALKGALEAEGFHPQMLEDEEMRAVYEGWFQTYAKGRIALTLADPAAEKPPYPLNLNLHFARARELTIENIDGAYAALPPGDCYVLVGKNDEYSFARLYASRYWADRMPVCACARLRTDRLPSLRLLDSFLHEDVYLADAAGRFCLAGLSNFYSPSYLLAEGAEA